MSDSKNDKISIKVPCTFRNGQKISVPIYIGDPMFGTHPFEFQNRWLTSSKGGSIPADVLESYAKLKEVADRNRIKFSELCQFVDKEVNGAKEMVHEYNRVNAPLNPPQRPQPATPQRQAPQNFNPNTNNPQDTNNE